jgi:cytidylate kinase
MKRVVVIEREYGCGGGAIAERLAGQLGWKLWDQALTQEIARRAKVDSLAVQRCDERTDTFLHRIAKVFWRGSYEQAMPFEPSGVFDTDRMVVLVREIIAEATDAGNCVIVGRGAPYILRARKDALHVFLYAPRREKLRRLLAVGKSEEEGNALLDTVDRERADFVKSYFGMEWPTRSFYHLMVNTAVGDAAVAETIRFALETFDR